MGQQRHVTSPFHKPPRMRPTSVPQGNLSRPQSPVEPDACTSGPHSKTRKEPQLHRDPTAPLPLLSWTPGLVSLNMACANFFTSVRSNSISWTRAWLVSKAGSYEEWSLRARSSKLGVPNVRFKVITLPGEAWVLSSQGLIGSLGGES